MPAEIGAVRDTCQGRVNRHGTEGKLMAIGRPSQGIDAMPTLRAKVDREVEAEFRAIARQRKVSVSTVVREVLYEIARNEWGLDLPEAPAAAAVQK